MRRRRFITGIAAGLIVATGGGLALAAKAPASWDGLTLTKSKRMDLVYLAPGADFRTYHKVMLDPTEVAFEKNWKRDFNNQTRGLGRRVDDDDIQKAVTEGGRVATGIFADAFNKGGYPVVSAPGPDVLRIRTAVVNLRVNAPDIQTAGRSYNFAPEAGEATLILEARDSVTGALLGRVVDRRLAGDNSTALRNRVTNRADFRVLGKTWAKHSVDGLNNLKASSPMPGAAGQ
jgi:hypothetical protein